MEKKLCIGIDASRANRAEKTGVEWYAFYLIQEFKKLIPSDFRVILYSAEPLMGGLEVLPQNWESKIIKGVNLGRGPWLWTQLGLTWEMIKSAPDILFVPSHAIPLIHPKRTYTAIHDVGFRVFPEAYHFLPLIYHRLTTRFAVWRATKIFTPSEFTKRELIKYYRANPEKIIVTPLGFDADVYHPRNKEVSPQQDVGVKPPQVDIRENPEKQIPPLILRGARGSYKTIHEPYVLFIGRIEKKKNVKRLIEAFIALKAEVRSPESEDLKLVIVGTPGFGYDEIKEAAANSKDVIFTGYMPTADLPGILRGASVYALPSLYEGFGIPILEAFASGVPVLTSNTASMPEVCCKKAPGSPEAPRSPQVELSPPSEGGARGGLNNSSPQVGEGRERGNCAACLVDPLSVESIKEGLKKILMDQAYRDDLIARGLARTKDFSWELTAQKTLNSVIHDK